MFDLLWYNTLIQPPFTPPSWVFAPAWTFLYLTIFAWFIIFAFKKTAKSKIWGYILFFSQMFLNLSWPPVFFYFHNIALALVILVFMLILVIWNIIEFYNVSKASAILLMPYLAWIIYAVYLNSGFLVLN